MDDAEIDLLFSEALADIAVTQIIRPAAVLPEVEARTVLGELGRDRGSSASSVAVAWGLPTRATAFEGAPTSSPTSDTAAKPIVVATTTAASQPAT